MGSIMYSGTPMPCDLGFTCIFYLFAFLLAMRLAGIICDLTCLEYFNIPSNLPPIPKCRYSSKYYKQEMLISSFHTMLSSA